MALLKFERNAFFLSTKVNGEIMIMRCDEIRRISVLVDPLPFLPCTVDIVQSSSWDFFL